jgi:hypothetical protein
VQHAAAGATAASDNISAIAIAITAATSASNNIISTSASNNIISTSTSTSTSTLTLTSTSSAHHCLYYLVSIGVSLLLGLSLTDSVTIFWTGTLLGT